MAMNWRRLLAAGVLLSTGATAATSAGPAAGATVPEWIVSSHGIRLINGYMGSTTLTKNAFDVPSTAELGTPAKGWVTQRTVKYNFYGPASKPSSFLYALRHNQVPAGTVNVMLDLESWALTPHPEQVTPKVYFRQFVRAAHQHGYKAILAPAISLTKGMTCGKKSHPAWKKYLTDCSVPAMAARAGPDMYEIQSQRFEANTSSRSNCGCFAWFVRQAAAQARAVVAGLDIRAGLSTNPSGHVSSGRTLYTDTLNTEGSVRGYWLNVPTQGIQCPSCRPDGAPQVAARYLQLLGYSS